MTEATKKRLLSRGPDGKPTHKYVPAAETNVAATFARVRRQMKEAESVKASSNVKALRKEAK